MAAEKAMKQETGMKVAKVGLDSKMLQLQYLRRSLKKKIEREGTETTERPFLTWNGHMARCTSP